MRKIIFCLALFACQIVICQIVPISKEIRIEKSPLIVEGSIIDKETFIEKGVIKTDFSLKINSVIKGNIKNDIIKIRSLGGTMGTDTYITCPNDNLYVGLSAKFLLNKKEDYYETQFFGQSVFDEIHYDEELMPDEGSQNKNAQNPTMTLDNISPSEIIIGNGDILTITGSGFGATGPTAATKVWIKIFSGTSYYALQDSFYYVSWSDTEIKIKIPVATLSGSYKFGSGKVRVGSSTSFVESANAYEVKGVVKDYQTGNGMNRLPITLPALNSGGIKFIPNINFTNSTALTTMAYAIDNWVCNTGINMSLDTTQTTNLVAANDGVSVLFFDNTMSSSTLGITHYVVGQCNLTGRAFINDIDLSINSNLAFNFSLNSSASSEFDFYSVVLHELGHVRNLDHVNNINKVMYSSIGMGQERRSLHQHEIDAGLWVQNDSQTVQTCGKSLMTAGVCQNLNISDNQDMFQNSVIYPNPTHDFVTLDKEIESVKVFTILGQQIYPETKVMATQTQIDFSNFPTGVYLIETTIDGAKAISKIIKG